MKNHAVTKKWLLPDKKTWTNNKRYGKNKNKYDLYNNLLLFVLKPSWLNNGALGLDTPFNRKVDWRCGFDSRGGWNMFFLNYHIYLSILQNWNVLSLSGYSKLNLYNSSNEDTTPITPIPVSVASPTLQSRRAYSDYTQDELMFVLQILEDIPQIGTNEW